MGTQPIRQDSFAGGEYAPRLWSATRLAKYGVGLRRAHNFFLVPEGAALNRSGTLRVAEAKDSAAGLDRGTRFVPFVFSEVFGQAYVLEFGQGYLRFHVGGSTIADPLNPAQPYEIATPYAAADLPFLKYAQQGDVVTLTCRGYDPRELRRLAHDEWELEVSTFDVPTPNGQAFLRVGVLDNAEDATHPKRQWNWQVTEIWEDTTGLQWETSPLEIDEIGVQAGDEWHAKFPYPAGAYVKRAGAFYRSYAGPNLNHMPDGGDGAVYWEPVGYVPAPPAVYTMPIPSSVVLYPDRTASLWVRGTWGIILVTSRVVARRVFRGRGTFRGYVGEFDEDEFLDTGDTPDLGITPPQGRNPFKVYGAGDTFLRLERPAVVTYQDERRVFLGTDERPATAFLGRVGDYSNFDKHVPTLADDAFEVELAGRKREAIRWAVGGEQLLVGTMGSVWALRAPQGEVVTPTSREAKAVSSAGASWLDPLVIPSGAGDAVLYVRTKGTGVRDLVFQDGRWAGSDLAILAHHLFTGYEITAWAYQEDPWGIVWAVRSDGKLLSLTYVREQEVWAWAWHDTQGFVEDVCTIPEGGEDALYLLVRRQLGDGSWHRYVERMESRVIKVDENGRPAADAMGGTLFLDCAVTALDVESEDGAATIGGLGHLEGLEVVALADGMVLREGVDNQPLVVQGGAITIPDEEGEGFGRVHVGLSYSAELELLDLAVQGANLRNQVKQVNKVAFEVEASRGLEVAESADAPDEEWAEWDQRTVEHGYGTLRLFSGLAEVTAFSSWNKGGRAALRQRDPLPCTVLAVTREAEIGGT